MPPGRRRRRLWPTTGIRWGGSNPRNALSTRVTARQRGVLQREGTHQWTRLQICRRTDTPTVALGSGYAGVAAALRLSRIQPVDLVDATGTSIGTFTCMRPLDDLHAPLRSRSWWRAVPSPLSPSVRPMAPDICYNWTATAEMRFTDERNHLCRAHK